MVSGSPIRIALLSEVFCKNMGYLENMLPKYLARLGAEMHVLATDLPPDYRQKSSGSPYAGFLSEWQPGSQLTMDGFTLHILGHRKILGHMRMAGLGAKLREISPDIVQISSPIGWIALDAARLRMSVGYRLFTGCHYHASVFPLATQAAPYWSAARLKCFAARTIPGQIASLAAGKCYAITRDCAEVAVSFFGVPWNQIEICPLGVDTDVFVLCEARATPRTGLFYVSDLVFLMRTSCASTPAGSPRKKIRCCSRKLSRDFSRKGIPSAACL